MHSSAEIFRNKPQTFRAGRRKNFKHPPDFLVHIVNPNRCEGKGTCVACVRLRTPVPALEKAITRARDSSRRA